MPDTLPHTALCSYLSYAVDQIGKKKNPQHKNKPKPTKKPTNLKTYYESHA